MIVLLKQPGWSAAESGTTCTHVPDCGAAHLHPGYIIGVGG